MNIQNKPNMNGIIINDELHELVSLKNLPSV